MESVLPNLRLLCLPSENLGKDWLACVDQLDQRLHQMGWELAEETVYLIFSSSPGAVLAGEGACQAGRPVIGAKKTPEAPFSLVDWTAQRVRGLELKKKNWSEILEEAYNFWEKLQRSGVPTGRGMVLQLQRRLAPELELKASVFFLIDDLSA